MLDEMRRVRVLLVEDDHELRGNLAQLLDEQGMAVREAATGNEALDILAEEREFDLVVTDVILPAPLGTQLAAMARTAGASVPILVITAQRDDPRIPRTVDQLDQAELLLKPFSADEFMRHVRGLLDESRPP
jgi:two-component system, OmpR family, response regulator PhoP